MAEALSCLVPPDRPAPVFVSLVGDDAAGGFLTASLRRLRLDLSQLVTCPGAPTACVSAVMDRGGEVAACVADVVTVEEQLNPERLAESRQQIQQACLVLAEANLAAASLEYVCRTAAQARVPVFLEPVSVPKAARLAPSLPNATFVSPNAAELVSLADEVRRAAGLPLLPRPSLLDDGEAAGKGGGARSADSASGSGSGGDEAQEPVVELLRQLAVYAEVVLLQGTFCVVLTLGSLGAALITLCDVDVATPRQPLAPLDAASSSCSRNHHAQAHGPPGPGPDAASSLRPQRCGDGFSRGEAAAASDSGRTPPVAGSSHGSPQPASGEEALDPALTSAPAAVHGLCGGRGGGGAVQVLHLRALPAEVASVSGAGDTLVAGMVAALLQQQEPVMALAYGMAAAKRAVESHRNVPDLSFSSLRGDADRVAATLRRHIFPAGISAAPVPRTQGP